MVQVNQVTVSLGRQISLTHPHTHAHVSRVCIYIQVYISFLNVISAHTYVCMHMCHIYVYVYINTYISFLNVISSASLCYKMAINSSWIKKFSISTPEDR